MRRSQRPSPFALLCLFGSLAIFSTTMAKNPALPLFIRSLGVPDHMVGFVAAASTVVGILVSLPAGILSDLYGRRRVLLGSAFVFASAPFLYLLVHRPWHLVAVRIYHGLATAILGPVALAVVADTFEARRGESMAWYSSATMLGRFLAPSIGGLLILGSDFHWVYLGCGVAGVFALLLATHLPVSGQSEATATAPTLRGAWEPIRQQASSVLRDRRIGVTSFVEASQYFAFGFLEVYLPLQMAAAGWKAWQIGPLFALQVLATTLSKPIMGRLTDRVGRPTLIVSGLMLGAIGLLLVSTAESYLLLAPSVGLFGLGMAAVTAATAALVTELAQQNAYGAATGILSSIMDVGHSAGPMIGGLLVGALGYGAAFAGVGAMLLATGWIFSMATRHH